MTPRVLIVDDEPDVIRGFERILAAEPFEILSAGSGDEAIRVCREQRPEVVVTDLRMPGVNGLQTLRELRKIDPRILVILMTAYGTTQTVIEAMKAGAYEYVQKPFKIDRIREVVRGAVKAAAQMRQVVTYQPLLQEEEHTTGVIGKSEVMQEVFKKIGQVTETDATVLITGESGTGKELVARAIYHHSRRSNRPFLAVNCAAIPEALLESELFGHERGAFTGAVARRPGKFEAANEGTLFLDEIGDMSPAIQAKILRVLQNGEFERLGSNVPIRVNVRLLAATNRDLEAMVRTGEFRPDLFYRLNVVRIHLPALRERTEDIPLLVEYFARKYQDEVGRGREIKFSAATLQRLQEHPWPGNIRELENCLRTTLLTAKSGTILAEDLAFGPSLSESRASGVSPSPVSPPSTPVPQAGMEPLVRPLFDRLVEARKQMPSLDVFDLVGRSLIAEALERCDGNQVRAAQLLGISRSTLRKRIARYGLSIQTRIEHVKREDLS
jgi:DNA-binding NtrC family response regulator